MEKETLCYICKHKKLVFIDDVKWWRILKPGTLLDLEPCGNCAKVMEKEIIIAEIDSDKTDPKATIILPGKKTLEFIDTKIPDTYRTGRLWSVPDSSIIELIEASKKAGNMEMSKFLEDSLKRRYIFLPVLACRTLGLHKNDPLQ